MRRGIVMVCLCGGLMLLVPPAPASSSYPLAAANGEEWFRLQRAYPSGRLAPADALPTATAGWRSRVRAGGATTALTLSGDRWVSLGPEPIAASGGDSYAGRITSVAPHPTAPGTIYAASNSGGIWKTTNMGANWAPLIDSVTYPAMASIAVDPENPLLIYAVTMARTYPSRLLRSTDAGVTWTESAIVTTDGETLVYAGKVLVDPARAGSPNTSTLFIIGFSNVLRSDDSGRTWRSVLRLSPDQDFTSVSTRRLASAPTIRDLTTDPSTANNLHLIVAEPRCLDEPCSNATATIALYRSFNSGASWTRGGLAIAGRYTVPDRRHTEIYGPYTPRARVVVAPSDPNVVVVGFLDDEARRPRVFRSIDGGEAFAETAQVPTGVFAWPLALAISPSDPDDLLVGNFGIVRSSNGGASWTDLGVPHGDETVIAFTADGTVILGDDGGMFRLSDTGTFAHMNNGLSITEAYSVATHPSNPVLIVSGTQDNGGIQLLGALGWLRFHGGDGGDMVFEPSPDSQTLYSEVQWFTDPSRTTNDFQFFRCGLGRQCEVRNAGLDLSDAGPFIPRMAIDPIRRESLWLTAERLYRTDDEGSVWQAASTKVSATERCWTSAGGATAAEACASGGYFTAVAVSESDSDIIYAGALNGDVWRTTNRGATWVSVAGTTVAPLPVRPVTDIQIDTRDPMTAYATYSGFEAAGQGAGHVFRTRDGGQSWTNITGALPDLPVNTVLIDPDSSLSDAPRVVYVGTDIGVYRLTDAGIGSEWQPYAAGMPLVPVTDLTYNPVTRMLVAATYGRGLWTISSRFSR